MINWRLRVRMVAVCGTFFALMGAVLLGGRGKGGVTYAVTSETEAVRAGAELQSGDTESDMMIGPMTAAEEETELSELDRCSRAGIDGMRSCVERLKSFYQAGQTKQITSGSDEILVGTKAVNRSAINRNAFCRQAAKAGELGYDALQAVAENQMSYTDYYTLLQIVEAEATGGDVRSKQLIANVVLNRVNDPRFPDTIYEVVWQRVDGSAQFSPTMDGRISSCSITETTIEAVERALSGEDDSQGALFFFARSHSASSSVAWFEHNLEKLFEYGGHEFFRFKTETEMEEEAG